MRASTCSGVHDQPSDPNRCPSRHPNSVNGSRGSCTFSACWPRRTLASSRRTAFTDWGRSGSVPPTPRDRLFAIYTVERASASVRSGAGLPIGLLALGCRFTMVAEERAAVSSEFPSPPLLDQLAIDIGSDEENVTFSPVSKYCWTCARTMRKLAPTLSTGTGNSPRL